MAWFGRKHDTVVVMSVSSCYVFMSHSDKVTGRMQTDSLHTANRGALVGGSQCDMSILRS